LSKLQEQNGFANLLRGVFGTIRNPSAHATMLTWQAITEQDALDLLTLVSVKAFRETWTLGVT
jgi:hypothetical protein